jgi:hypothetical protein
MHKPNFLAQAAACAAALGMLLPAGVVSAANPTTVQSVRQVSHDVVLTEAGLTGQYLTAEGVPVDGAIVLIRRGGQEVTRATTDGEGVFTARGLSSGVYEVVTPTGMELVRLWEADAAPPAARPSATFVSQQAVRGQMGGPDLNLWNGMAIAFGIAGMATGIVGITKANSAKDDVRDLEARVEALESP